MAEEKSAVECLKEKIEARYEKQRAYWLEQSPKWLIDMAGEILAFKQMRETLANFVTEEDAQYLLRFKDPLEVISDKWLTENGMDNMPGEAMGHILWELRDKQDAEHDYELEAEFERTAEQPRSIAPEQTQQMSV